MGHMTTETPCQARGDQRKSVSINLYKGLEQDVLVGGVTLIRMAPPAPTGCEAWVEGERSEL